MKKSNKIRTTLILILIVVASTFIVFAGVEGGATLLGWAYKVTNGSGRVNLTYNYTSLNPWINNETNLDLFYWNTTDWKSLNATLNITKNTLKIEVNTTDFPMYIVLGEK